jgi:hypothetical protein
LDGWFSYRMVCNYHTHRIKLIYLANIEMVETNAILAINSLDRYKTNQLTNVTRFRCSTTIGSNQIQFIAADPDTPIVGSSCSSDNIGLLGSTITAYNPVTGIITLNFPALSTQVNVLSIWRKEETVATYNNNLEEQYAQLPPYANDFTIQSSGSLIYGYIRKIIVSQVQIQYAVPTVILGKNDTFYISVSAFPTAGFATYAVVIPYGFYYADELAATLQQLIRAINAVRFAGLLVTFVPRNGFVFNNNAANRNIAFPLPEEVRETIFLSRAQTDIIYKTYKLLGINTDNVDFENIQTSSAYPEFLYTPYIDFYSDVLTNYQKVKDTNTSVTSPKGLVARVYLSGVGGVSTSSSVGASGRAVGQLGTEPFVMTADLNFPKVIMWTADQTVTAIDFQVRDCYGDLLPGVQEGFNTEFQMTLLCTEGDT